MCLVVEEKALVTSTLSRTRFRPRLRKHEKVSTILTKKLEHVPLFVDVLTYILHLREDTQSRSFHENLHVLQAEDAYPGLLGSVKVQAAEPDGYDKHCDRQT